MKTYTFGTGLEAADRLELMADFFNPRAETLIREFPPVSVGTAVDLGCGPGFTTDMLARATGAAETVGLDDSEEFLALARAGFPGLRFIKHDITRLPFPTRADVMYVRFVLSHLPNPVDLIRAWLAQLNPGGVLVMEETEAVETDVPCFRMYLDANAALVGATGTRLFVGAALAAGDYSVRPLLNECIVLPVPNSLAARWFLPNARTIWRTSEVIRARLRPEKIEEISSELERLAGSASKVSRITWRIRRIVLGNTGR